MNFEDYPCLLYVFKNMPFLGGSKGKMMLGLVENKKYSIGMS